MVQLGQSKSGLRYDFALSRKRPSSMPVRIGCRRFRWPWRERAYEPAFPASCHDPERGSFVRFGHWEKACPIPIYRTRLTGSISARCGAAKSLNHVSFIAEAKIMSDFEARNHRAWKNALKTAFGTTPPRSATWSDVDGMINILKPFMARNLNHAMA